MKSIILMIIGILFSTNAFCTEVTGKILNLVPDDEGLKVIVQSAKDPLSLYLSNQSVDFQKYTDDLQAAKKSSVEVKIQIKDNALSEITKIQNLK